MSDFVLAAELREKTGRGEARRLRRSGRLPAIIYGGDKPELPVSLDALTVSKLLQNESFYTSIIELKVKGVRGVHKGLVKEIQWHPVRDDAMHIDFMRVSSASTVHLEVPVHAANTEECPGVIKGGLVEIIRHALEVTCRADRIPESIDVDCSGLEIGDSVHVEDLVLPEGVEVLHDVNFTVLTIAAPTKMEAAAPSGETEEGPTGEE